MLHFSSHQFETLARRAREGLPARLRLHWAQHHASLLACFSEEEIGKIAARSVELGLADPQRSEQEIVVMGDLWLFELAARRKSRA